jgi:hypothetical protein
MPCREPEADNRQPSNNRLPVDLINVRIKFAIEPNPQLGILDLNRLRSPKGSLSAKTMNASAEHRAPLETILISPTLDLANSKALGHLRLNRDVLEYFAYS